VTAPTPPIALAGGSAAATARLASPSVSVSDRFVAQLEDVCSQVSVAAADRAEASRDWWPLAMMWALDGQVGGLAAVVARPADAAEVAAVLDLCDAAGVPVTPAAGRSGVCGASVPVHGGVILDLTAMSGLVGVDQASLTIEVLPGTFGGDLERTLRADHGLTLGHWPQSMELSTVGGWLACRSAGQLSTRYGKIEDMVVGLDVVLAGGRRLRTGGGPRAAMGPDLTQLFVGSEGTLGVITAARLRVHPVPTAERRAAYGFASFLDGLDACRRILRRGATPAVLRLYDEVESQRSHGTAGTLAVLLVMDEGDELMVEATMTMVSEECTDALRLSNELVERWMQHRNDVSALEALTRKGFVVDTMEVAGPWAALPRIYREARAALAAVPHTRAATAHQSHAYGDGACLYFTFAATPPPEEREATYLALWEAGTRAVLDAGGNLSHHHGIGLHRGRFLAEALGPAHGVLADLKATLDPHGILNPGKLGLPSPFGRVAWP